MLVHELTKKLAGFDPDAEIEIDATYAFIDAEGMRWRSGGFVGITYVEDVGGEGSNLFIGIDITDVVEWAVTGSAARHRGSVAPQPEDDAEDAA